ncbi:unnamed protein product, partial [Brassica rapa subsp. narinosa]
MEVWRRKKEKGKARKCFLKNGSMFLHKLIADCNGISNPIRMFSSDQISKATNHFDPNDFLKLIGCCLEYPFPVVVFEDLDYRVLNKRGSIGSLDAPLLPWNVRLKIAKEVATAITYLHTAFPRTIIHRDIKAENVFLDKNGTAKLTDLSNAVTLPKGKSRILEVIVVGTFGYLDPDYSMTGFVTEYSDVFSFGIFMLVLLMGRPPISDGSPDDGRKFIGYVRDLHERGEPVEFGGDSNDMRPGQMEMFLDLALRCCQMRVEDRPKMILRVMGTVGYLDPLYIATNFVTEYTDVFSFGVFLMVLLTARPALLITGSDGEYKGVVGYVKGLYENGKLDEVIDPSMFTNNTNGQRLQVEACVVLAMRCCEKRDEDRPKMIQVAKELKLCNLRHNHSTMGFWWSKKENRKVETSNVSNCFLKNGSMFLQQLIADCNGISNPIRMFSSDQISKVNDHFDPNSSIVEDTDTYFTWYKGEIEGRPCAIKRYTERLYVEEEMAYNDIVLSARVMLVFENLGYTVLNERGTVGYESEPLLPWNLRLKIAKEIAIAITYLHTAFSRIIIHRDIKATNVFLDKNGTAKLTDFFLAVSLPEGKSSLEDTVMGTAGYLDPNYCTTNIVTEYSDVFSFGILMLVLLTGKQPYKPGYHDWKFLENVKDLHERGEPVEFGGDSNDMKPVQMKMFLELALRCCEKNKENRPKMILVAKEIKLIETGS